MNVADDEQSERSTDAQRLHDARVDRQVRLAVDLATVRAERDQLRQTVRDLEAQMPARDARVAAEAKRIAGRAVLAYWGGDVTRDDQAGTWMQAVHGGDTDDPEDWEEAYREADGLGAP